MKTQLYLSKLIITCYKKLLPCNEMGFLLQLLEMRLWMGWKHSHHRFASTTTPERWALAT